MSKEKQATPEDAIEHARRYGRDFATDRIAKNMPEYAPANYWSWPENPVSKKQDNVAERVS